MLGINTLTLSLDLFTYNFLLEKIFSYFSLINLIETILLIYNLLVSQT